MLRSENSPDVTQRLNCNIRFGDGRNVLSKNYIGGLRDETNNNRNQR